MKSIEEAEIIEGTIVLIRTDWNLPLDKEGEVLDTSRIEASVKTINFCLEKGAKVIIMSHLGDGTNSLEKVFKQAEKFFPNIRVRFIKDPWNSSAIDGKTGLEDLRSGEIAILENLRFWMEKENDEGFARQLADFADIYINEAFSASHRKHTSIVGVPKLIPSFAGFRFLEEYQNLSESFDPEHPFLVILGGAKFETKLPLVEKFLNIADYIFVGGAMASHATSLAAENPKIILPEGDLNALDANPETLEVLKEKIVDAKFILWNGPLGNYEKGFIAGTTALARVLSESKAKVIVGGGDTLATVNRDVKNQITTHGFISTAGGAMLDFLANGTLPGIEALEK